MKIAFYKAFQSSATKLDKAIAIFTFGPYSHCELIFSEGDSFSISPRDGGSRYKHLDYNLNNWDLYDLELSKQDEKTIRECIKNNYMNKKYDYIGALFSALPFCVQKDERLFCSEVAVNILRRLPKFSSLDKGCTYSPNFLFNNLGDLSVKRTARREDEDYV